MKHLLIGVVTGFTISTVAALSIYTIYDSPPVTKADISQTPTLVRSNTTVYDHQVLADIYDTITAIHLQNNHLLERLDTMQAQVNSLDIHSGQISMSTNTTAESTIDTAVDDAITTNMISSLYDPDYTSSTNITEIMSSDEMNSLSQSSRERVVAEMVRMLNSGEIDRDSFMPGANSQ